VKLNPGLSWQKLHSARRRLLFTSKFDLNLRKKLIKCYIWSMAFYGAETWTLLKVGRFGQQIRNTWKVSKYGTGEGWRRSVRPIT